ncbi:hypothetical protein AMTRI_Chr08g207800 [Amborella trichopoda]
MMKLKKRVNIYDIIWGLITFDRVQSWELLLGNICDLSKGNNESHDHLFISCKFVSDMYKAILGRFDAGTTALSIPSPLTNWFEKKLTNRYLAKIWKVSLTTIWVIWQGKTESKSRLRYLSKGF